MSDEPVPVDLSDYHWMVPLTCIFGFIYAFGIGANDVANAFASTVSSGSLTLKQAVMVAAVMEFSGSFFLGASVTGTIRSKIFSTSLFEDEPEVLMLGMMTSLFTSMFLLLFATQQGLPVSTTHTVVGAIMGFAICARGFDAVNWSVVKKIFLSWIISPGVSGIVAFIFFGTIRFFILRHANSFERAFYTFPVVLTAGIGIDMFYVLYKGVNNVRDFTDEKPKIIGISFAVGAFCGLLWIYPFGPIAKQRAIAHVEDTGRRIPEPDEEIDVDAMGDDIVKATDKMKEMKEAETDSEGEAKDEPVSWSNLGKKFADMTYNQDLKKQSFHENKKAQEIWDEGEKFDPNTEQLFTYIQVFTACLNSFAHGANDVANAIAPVSAVVAIYNDGFISKKSEVQKWILAYGGIGIVLGLLMYGYIIMKTLGYKMTILSPSRGACAELAASLFVVTASFLEIPVSSTQSICGAVVGVGIVGGLKNVQWLQFLKVCIGWVGIFFASTLCSSAVFSFVAFSPTLSTPTIEQLQNVTNATSA